MSNTLPSREQALVMGIDSGTEGIRAVLCDLQGREVASASCGYPTSFPAPGWAEQRPRTGGARWSRACAAPAKSSVRTPERASPASAWTAPVPRSWPQKRTARRWLTPSSGWIPAPIGGGDHPPDPSPGAQILRRRGRGRLDGAQGPVAEARAPGTVRARGKARREPRLDDLPPHRRMDGLHVQRHRRLELRHPHGRLAGGFLRQLGLEDVLEKWPQRVLFMGDLAGRLTEEAAAQLGLRPGSPWPKAASTPTWACWAWASPSRASWA